MLRLTILLVAMLLLCSCSTQARYAYVGDAQSGEVTTITNGYATQIFPGDLLYIYVYSQSPQTVVPYNQETNHAVANAKPQGYFVATDGCIVFPSLGRVDTKGYNLEEFGHLIERKLIEGGYVLDPIVTVSLLNFRVTVIGEVKYPRQIHADGNRITLFEAIAQCGDITMDGVRERVVIVRNQGPNQVVDTLDLTSKQVLNSPYYYLQQNDIIYVEPSEKKKRIAYRNEDWPHYLSTGVSAVRMAYLVIYRIARVDSGR